ncbi:MAG: hypothetical protein M3Y40_04715 [Chloroflexota bacterium]|nr:hypothetical protein [Chloroflexota bacterium]
MHSPGSVAERLDHALDQLAAGATPAVAAATVGLEPSDRMLVHTASRLRHSLVAPPVSTRFEARLGARLAGVAAPRDGVGWALRHPGRLIVTGAVGSAVGVGVTAYAVWRTSRRASARRR